MNIQANKADADLGAELLNVIARLNRWSTRHANRALPVAQARLLAQIDELGAARISAIARADHCSQPGMTMQVKRLEAAGLARRAADPADARAALISLTSKGYEVLREVRAARAESIAPLVNRLTGADRARLRAELDTLEDLLDAASRLPHNPESRKKD